MERLKDRFSLEAHNVIVVIKREEEQQVITNVPRNEKVIPHMLFTVYPQTLGILWIA
jgi:hypothetical protein